MDDDDKILGSTQVIGAPIILQSTASSRPAKRATTTSSSRRHRYNYRNDSGVEDGDKEFFASPLAFKDDEDLIGVEVVKNPSQKSRE